MQMGILRSLVNIKDLELLKEQDITGPSLNTASSSRKGGGSRIPTGKAATISPEINLIGMNVDEACSVLDKYLDDAYLSRLPSVRVVHGRGTGALRAGIHKYLKRLKYVKEFHLGEFGEGDSELPSLPLSKGGVHTRKMPPVRRQDFYRNINKEVSTLAEKQKILIVDDDANIAELISLYLMKECYETQIVGDGEEALKVFASFRPI